MCGYFFIGFIDFMLTGNSLIDFTGLFFPDGFKENDDIILSYFEKKRFLYLIHLKKKMSINEIFF